MHFPKPKEIKDVEELPLQSILFGHRLKPDQTVYEYLLEFLQVMIANKEVTINERTINTSEFFPEVIDKNNIEKLKIHPTVNMGFRRFVFFDKSKKDTQSKSDEEAFEAHKEWIKEQMEIDDSSLKKHMNNDDIIEILQGLLYSFNGVINERSWCAQTLLPICKEVILPEAMPSQAQRRNIKFKDESGDISLDIDIKFQFNRYNFMARGGEVYYLHIVRALSQYPEYRKSLEIGFNSLLTSFPQLEKISKFIQKVWEENVWEDREDARNISKELSYIPTGFDNRNIYTLKELKNFLSTDMHPFEKIEVLSQAVILQIIRMQHVQASKYNGVPNPIWIMDVTDNTDKEVKKQAVANFQANEENIIKAVNKGFEQYEKSKELKRDKALKEAESWTYKLYRRLGKEIGLIIPLKGIGMRFTLSETLIKFLVTSIIEPGKKLTVDTFIDRLYEHYGMIIDSEHYEKVVDSNMIEPVSNRTFLYNNKRHFIQKLKECGFLRDLSDATSIVENPYSSNEN